MEYERSRHRKDRTDAHAHVIHIGAAVASLGTCINDSISEGVDATLPETQYGNYPTRFQNSVSYL